MSDKLVMSLLSNGDIFDKSKNLISNYNLTDTFKYLGSTCSSSDLAIASGLFEDDTFGKRTSDYFIRNNYCIYNMFVTLNGTTSWADNSYYNIGIRPAIEFDEIPMEIFDRLFNYNGVTYVYFGEYPQVAVCNEKLLRISMECGDVIYTGREYATRMEWYSNMMSYAKCREFEYKEDRYIETSVFSPDFRYVVLSNGKRYKNNDRVILRVMPVLWVVDIRNKKLISKDILLSNIRFSNRNREARDFENTEMYNFLNSYMLNDMIYQSRDYNKVKLKAR